MARCPFDKDSELNVQPTSSKENHLPGYPRIQLNDGQKLLDFLERSLFPADLEKIADKLWWMSTQDSKNVSPLHRQYVKSRRIIITEDPKLHLVWIKDRIFIKPLPEFLLSHSFWEHYLLTPPSSGSTVTPEKSAQQFQQQAHVCKAALGLLRTYAYLVRHESDFRIAQDPSLCLIPRRVTWEQFCAFSARFDAIRDDEVSWRYSYGEIRLTRLNFYAKFIMGKWYFHRLAPQYGDYFARFYAPMLFLFGFLSVVLSAMQVEIAVEQLDTMPPWYAFQRASRVFTVLSLLAVGALTLYGAFLFVYKFAKEWRYALADRYIYRRDMHEIHRKRNEAPKPEVNMKLDKQSV